ncbi:hypothetical protein [Maribellus sediminis]|uniref:hypothetical protein n=1 Tax=Maribellus sediminis TaxID=2696285 RepID=UPI001431AAF3|nr:hypothetical protein [Maribellus sediminis]
MKDILEHLPEIIKAASSDPLSMIAFFIVVISLLAYTFFNNENIKVKISVFIAITLGLGYMIYAFLNFYKQMDNNVDIQKPTVIYSDESPKIIGIYPKDIFGLNQKEGLVKSLDNNKIGIDLIHMDFLSYNEMKSEKFNGLLDSLKTLLLNENIIAIAGPPITECADDALKVIEETKSKVPVFNTSAAPQSFLKWNEYNKKINLYRIGTGTDDRARSMAEFLKRHTNDIKKTALLVETNHSRLKTYGEIFLDEMIKASPELVSFTESGLIKVFYFDRSNIDEYDSLFNSIKYDYNSIFLFGVGEPYSHTIDKYYKGSFSEDSLAMFGGYMFGYALNDELNKSKSDIINERIFEITDLNLGRSEGIDAPMQVNKFRSEFGGFHPGLRDEASYYDIGLCMIQALAILRDSLNASPSKNIKFNEETLNYLNKILKQNTFNGISNEIRFDARGINSKSILKTAVYDSINNKWKSMHRDSIMNLR